MRRLRYTAGLLLAFSLIAAACGGGGSELTLGTVLPLTGDLSDFGPSMENGVSLAVQEANAAGGVNGSDIVLVTADSGTNEDVAQQSANNLAAEGVAAIVGAASSRITLSFIDSAVQNEIVLISPSNTSPQFTGYSDNGFYFRTAHSDALQGPIVSDMMLGDGVGNIGIIALADSYGQGLADAISSAFEAGGGSIAIRQDYDPNGTNFDAEVTNVAGAGVDAVVCVCFPETGSVIFKAAFEQGLIPNLPWYTVDGLQSSTFPGETFPDDPAVLSGYRGTGPGAPAGDDPTGYGGNYNAEFGADPGPFSANSYDAAWLIILAAEAGDGSGPSIAEELAGVSGPPGTLCSGAECLTLLQDGEDIDYEGSVGPIDFDGNGDLGRAYFDIWQWNDSGTFDVLETGIEATAG